MTEGRRVESLDYLRGLMAVSVMLYHYTVDVAGPLDASGLLARLGVYAVASFYILSGVSLGMVYLDRLSTARDAAGFWVRRLFRIAPLYAVAVALMVAMRPGQYPAERIVSNVTLAFGFISPADAIPKGGWSIGDEVVFYVLFPVLALARSRTVVFAALAISAAVAAWFAFVALNPTTSLASQWSAYVHPLNQLFLFVGGVAIVRLGRLPMPWLLAASAVACFWLFPASGDGIAITTGAARVALSLACLLVVAVVYQQRPEFHPAAARWLAILGQGCYSIYLLHPIVARAVEWALIDALVSRIVAVPLTIAVAMASFRYIERPMMHLGASAARAITARNIRGSSPAAP